MNTRREQELFARFAEGVERERARYLLPSYRRGLLCTSATVPRAVGLGGWAKTTEPIKPVPSSLNSPHDYTTHQEM